jgi:hypothetical protein
VLENQVREAWRTRIARYVRAVRRRWIAVWTLLGTDRRGRWSGSNQFSGRPGTYPIRLRIRRQARFPFVLGYSRVVRVTVR